jgi:hypothetical protein
MRRDAVIVALAVGAILGAGQSVHSAESRLDDAPRTCVGCGCSDKKDSLSPPSPPQTESTTPDPPSSSPCSTNGASTQPPCKGPGHGGP